MSNLEDYRRDFNEKNIKRMNYEILPLIDECWQKRCPDLAIKISKKYWEIANYEPGWNYDKGYEIGQAKMYEKLSNDFSLELSKRLN